MMASTQKYLKHLELEQVNICNRHWQETEVAIKLAETVLCNLDKLQTISLICTNLTTHSFISIIAKNQMLEKLNISHNENVNDDVLEQISMSCKQLKFLNVKGCENISNFGIEKTTESCSFLEALEI